MTLSQDEDWPREAHRRGDLKGLDEAAQCSICHDVYQVPLSLACGHSFCSLCIRSNLEFQERTDKAKCPQCRKAATSQDLRPNIALGGLAQQYMAVRALLVGFAAASSTKSATTQAPSHASQANAARAAREDPQQAARPSRATSRAPRGGTTTSQPVTHEGVTGDRADHGKVAGASVASGMFGGAGGGGSVERGGVGGQGGAPGRAGVEEGLLRERVRGSRDAQSSRALPDGPNKKGGEGKAGAPQGRVLRSRPGGVARPDKENATQETSEGDDDFVVDLADFDPSPASTPVKRQRVDGPRQYSAGAVHPTAAAGKRATSAVRSYTPPLHVQGNAASGAASAGGRSTGQSRGLGGSRAPPVGPGDPPAGAGVVVKPGFVQCPVCSMTLKEAFLNVHLDRCLEQGGSEAPKNPKAPPGKRRKAGQAANGTRRLRSPRELAVPPSIVFPLIKDSQLKEKLRAYGLPTTGKRPELEQRYRDFRIAVQQANDAGLETSYRMLAQQYKAKLAAAGAATSNGGTPAALVNDDGGAVLDNAGASFEDLIRATREREGRPAPPEGTILREAPSSTLQGDSDPKSGSRVPLNPRTSAAPPKEARVPGYQSPHAVPTGTVRAPVPTGSIEPLPQALPISGSGNTFGQRVTGLQAPGTASVQSSSMRYSSGAAIQIGSGVGALGSLENGRERGLEVGMDGGNQVTESVQAPLQPTGERLHEKRTSVQKMALQTGVAEPSGSPHQPGGTALPAGSTEQQGATPQPIGWTGTRGSTPPAGWPAPPYLPLATEGYLDRRGPEAGSLAGGRLGCDSASARLTEFLEESEEEEDRPSGLAAMFESGEGGGQEETYLGRAANVEGVGGQVDGRKEGLPFVPAPRDRGGALGPSPAGACSPESLPAAARASPSGGALRSPAPPSVLLPAREQVGGLEVRGSCGCASGERSWGEPAGAEEDSDLMEVISDSECEEEGPAPQKTGAVGTNWEGACKGGPAPGQPVEPELSEDIDDDYSLPDAPYGCSQPPAPPPARPVLRSMSRFGA